MRWIATGKNVWCVPAKKNPTIAFPAGTDPKSTRHLVSENKTAE